MKYEIPIESPEHAAFCRAEAEKRYNGKIVHDSEGIMLLVKQIGAAFYDTVDGWIMYSEPGTTHTDDVLRALSFYEMAPEKRAKLIADYDAEIERMKTTEEGRATLRWMIDYTTRR